MTTVDLLTCPACGASLFADDVFCEACGVSIAAPRDVVQRHVEANLGVVAAVSDVGLVHVRNDDAFCADSRDGLVISVVCDGVSTAAAPQVAAVVAARTIADELRRSGAAAMAAALRSANDAVCALRWTPSPEQSGPACTTVAAVWDGELIIVGWAGDSRAYWCTPAGVQLLTVDHSWAAEQVAAGHMTDAAAQADRRAHTITRWIGDQGIDDGVAMVTFVPELDGRLVLCTDGLWNHVPSPDEIGRLASVAASPFDAATRLVGVALSRGGTDNVTVAVLDVVVDVEVDVAVDVAVDVVVGVASQTDIAEE